jgi:Tfp pilus assembly protein PilF
LVLVALALVYAFLAGLHTVWDLDMGWHLATGRYVVQHHVVPSTDILSSTSPGAEWLYPPFAGVLFYAVFSAFGYAGLSWFCALALLAMVACLLRNPARQGSGIAAALAILAVPALATRAAPRADLFTTLFFALFLAQLWKFHQGGAVVQGDGSQDRVRLWMLPVLMLLWVNLHPGFVAGLGILVAYLLIEGLELFSPSRRCAARQRLRQVWPVLIATVLATLFNPYGPRIYKASLLLTGLQAGNQPSSGPAIMELAPVPISLTRMAQALEWRYPDSGYWWLALVAVVVIALAFWRRQFGVALLVAAALYGSMQHLRYQALFSIVVVVVGSTVMSEALERGKREGALPAPKQLDHLGWLSIAAAVVLCLLTCVRIADLTSSLSYVMANSPMLFGPGDSWWFPESAAAFIQREHLPGNILQDYNLGGFTAWRLGPDYGDFIDGRNVSPAIWTELQKFISSPPDSPVWEAEADRRNINILFFSLARFYGVGSPNLASLCQSQRWRPIYLDEVSIVLLRNRPENRPWIDRNEVNCSTHAFAAPKHASRRELSNFYANAGVILLSLGRQSEAKEALDRGLTLSPEDPSIHFVLAQLYERQQQLGDAEREYKSALSLKTDVASMWHEFGRFYYSHGRYTDARPLIVTAARLSVDPAEEYILLGNIDLALQQPQAALIDFAKGEDALQGRTNLNPESLAQIAEARAVANFQLGDWQRAIQFQLEATRRTPENARRWEALAGLCEATGQIQLAEQARQQLRSLSK